MPTEGKSGAVNGLRVKAHVWEDNSCLESSLLEGKAEHNQVRDLCLLTQLFLRADTRGYKQDQWFALELFNLLPSQAGNQDRSRCFTPKTKRLSNALCSRASSGADTAPRLLRSSPSPRASSRGISTGCSLPKPLPAGSQGAPAAGGKLSTQPPPPRLERASLGSCQGDS